METSLLATKLYIPPARPGMVTRPRLLEHLRACINHSLTLVSAPAGFGKTTLLSDWVHHNQPPVPTAWLSLEEGENDPRRFWEYFTSAIKKIEPAIGDTCLTLLRSAQAVPIENILTTLINDIDSIPGDFVLVLDDYHFIQSQQVNQGLTFFVEHIPPGMHLVIATRVDPPLPLNRYRGRGTLLEVGADDLRFTREEAARLVVELGAPALSSDDIEALNARTEGWVVGLKMAVLSMRGEKDVSAFIFDFTGSQRYIMDYLVEEVLEQQPVEIRNFLLQTSVLERLIGPLCDAITQSSKGEEILLNLERANLFIIPLDMSRQLFRYHHLFRDLLQHRLRIESGEDELRSLHLKASRWYEANGFLEDAINHALAAQDWGKSMEIINNPEVRTHNVRSLTMLNWLRQIPEELLRTHLPIYWSYIWALEGTGQYKIVEDCLRYLDGVSEHDEHLQGTIAVARATITADMHDFSLAEVYARKALSLLPVDDVGIGIVSGILASIFMLQNRYVEAEPLIKRNYESLRQTGYTSLSVLLLIHLGLVAFLKGKLHQAVKTYHEAIELAEGHPANITQVCLAHLHLGGVYYMWNDLERALFHHERAIEVFQFSGSWGSMELDQAFLHLARTRIAIGDGKGAMEASEKADRLLEDKTNGISRARNAAFHVDIDLSQGDDDSASKWADNLLELEDSIPLDASPSALRLLDLRKGKTAAEEKHRIDYELFSQQGLQTIVIGIRLLQALNASSVDQALIFLADALVIARQEEYIRSFVDFGMSLAPLLRRAIMKDIEPEYARKLLDIIQVEDRERKIKKGKIQTSLSTSDILSERELEVLRLVAERLSNQQIADKLFITLNTVKTHVRHIFDKLGVNGRTTAIAKARDLKLL